MSLFHFPQPKGNGVVAFSEAAAAVACSDNPTDNPIVADILELAGRQQREAWEGWHRDREARFADKIHDEFDVLHDGMVRLATAPKARATAKKYKLKFDQFKRFAAETILDDGRGMRALPACAGLVCWFALSELARGQSYAAIKQCVAAISDAHIVNREPDPTQSLLVRAVIRYARAHAGKFANNVPKSNGKLNGKATEQQQQEASESDGQEAG